MFRPSLAITVLLALAGCGGSAGGGTSPPPPADSPPAGLTYSQNSVVYTVGETATPNVPTSVGGAVAGYSVAPALPPGLSLNSVTGVIGGVPTSATAQANYTVTASNSIGSTTAIVAIRVRAVLPPAGLSYLTSQGVYVVGSAVLANTPSSTGGAIASYAVSPALPTGLTLNPSTGVISGTPSVVRASANYTVMGSNAEGATSTVLAITVNDIPPANLVYSSNPATYVGATPIVANSPSNAGGAVVTYTVVSALPSGLNLDTRTGSITGTPMVLANSVYVVTATNSGGSTVCTLTIQVIAPPPPVIVTQPTKRYAPPDSTATFRVVASGSGPLSYQWDKNGTPVSGATSTSYTTPPITAGDDGAVFGVTVSDVFGGSVSSLGATLVAEGFATSGNMLTARSGFTAVALQNGKVLIAGGNGPSGTLALAELYDPSTGAFSATGSLGRARADHSAVLLANGKVLVIGGAGPTGILNSAELYDPSSGTFAPTGGMVAAGYRRTVTRLSNEKVLVAGGFGNGYLANAEVYDPATGIFSATGSMAAGRDGASAALLSNGKVLVAGGSNASAQLASAELYDPATGSFSPTGRMSTERYRFTATPLPNGKALMVGGKRSRVIQSSRLRSCSIPERGHSRPQGA